MAFLASTAAASLRATLHSASSFRRRPVLAPAIKATAKSESTSPHPIISSLRLAASAAVLLAATSPALACAPSPSPLAPAAVTDTVPSDDAAVPGVDTHSDSIVELIAETAALVGSGGADEARARLESAASWVDDSSAPLLAAQTMFVDGKVEEAIAALEELAQKDPSDYRPLFCQGVLYSALGRTEESVSALARCREVAAGKFDPDFLLKSVSPSDLDAESVAEKAEAEEVQA